MDPDENDELGVGRLKRIQPDVDSGFEEPPKRIKCSDNDSDSVGAHSSSENTNMNASIIDGSDADADADSCDRLSSSSDSDDSGEIGIVLGDEANILKLPKYVCRELLKYTSRINLNKLLHFQRQLDDCDGNPLVFLARLSDNPISALATQLAWKLILKYLVERPNQRKRLPNIKTIDDVVELLRNSKKIIVLTGAGVSVSCGIPDFRSRTGIYAKVAEEFPELKSPQLVFDSNFFKADPRPFFRFARAIYPGQFKPSTGHKFIKLLETKDKLLRNYSQNIDTLERVAGIKNVIECHGSFATATCTVCRYKVPSKEIVGRIFQQRIPFCTECIANSTGKEIGIMKPDIVFFGEDLPKEYHEFINLDKANCDLLIVIGSSLKVEPVCIIPGLLPNTVPQILINRERLGDPNFDVELIGDSDVIIDFLCRRLGEDWTEICWMEDELKLIPNPYSSSEFSSTSNDVLEQPKKAVNGCEKSQQELLDTRQECKTDEEDNAPNEECEENSPIEENGVNKSIEEEGEESTPNEEGEESIPNDEGEESSPNEESEENSPIEENGVNTSIEEEGEESTPNEEGEESSPNEEGEGSTPNEEGDDNTPVEEEEEDDCTPNEEDGDNSPIEDGGDNKPVEEKRAITPLTKQARRVSAPDGCYFMYQPRVFVFPGAELDL